MGTSSRLLYAEAVDLISLTTIGAVLYGIVFALYCLCTWASYFHLQEPDRRRQAIFSLVYTSLVVICGLGVLATDTNYIQISFINHPNYPGGPEGYEGAIAQHQPLALLGALLDTFTIFLTMAIPIWRLWVIWSVTRYAITVIILPLLWLLALTILSFLLNIWSYRQSTIKMSPQTATTLDTIAYGLESATTIFVTLLVVARLLYVRRRHIRLMGESEVAHQYMNIIAILIESYALDAVWSLITMLMFVLRGGPLTSLFSNNDFVVKSLAYFLVIYRVSSGRGWTTQTERKLTTLQWNRDLEAATSQASDTAFPESEKNRALE